MRPGYQCKTGDSLTELGVGTKNTELSLLASMLPPPCAFVLALAFLTFSQVCVEK